MHWSAWTTSAGSSCSSRAATPTCTDVTSCRQTTTGPTSASSSSTMPATRLPAGTARSPSSRGHSTRASSSGTRERTGSSWTCRRAASRHGRRCGTGGCAPCASATCRPSSGRQALSAGPFVTDVAYGGAFYASVREQVGVRELPRLIELGRAIKGAVEAEHDVVHPLEPELRDVYGVIFWQQEGEAPLTQRNVTVFADGEVDRSPCGSGTSARLALLDASGQLPRGAELTHLSIVGSAFTGRVVGDADVAGIPAVITEIAGSATSPGLRRSRSIRTTRSERASCCAEGPMDDDRHQSLELRPFRQDDGPAVVSFIRTDEDAAAWASLEEVPEEALLARWHADPDVHAFTLFGDGVPAGYGEVWVDRAEDETELARIVIDPARRGRAARSTADAAARGGGRTAPARRNMAPGGSGEHCRHFVLPRCGLRPGPCRAGGQVQHRPAAAVRLDAPRVMLSGAGAQLPPAPGSGRCPASRTP